MHKDSESLPQPYWPPSDEEGHSTTIHATTKLSEDNDKIVSESPSPVKKEEVEKGFSLP